ncbi:hypothetical protein ACHAPE_007906 [Trichoderma viride]
MAQNLSEAFFNEAQSLIVDKPELITLTTVSALQCLCIAAFGYGRDCLGMQFLRKSADIGTTMGLFGFGSEVESAISWLGDEDDWKRSASYTAWGVHNWISLWGLRYHAIEILTPSKIPMPGTLNTGPETQRFDTDAESINILAMQHLIDMKLRNKPSGNYWAGPTLYRSISYEAIRAHMPL